MRVWGCNSVVERLPSIPEALGPIHSAATKQNNKKQAEFTMQAPTAY